MTLGVRMRKPLAILIACLSVVGWSISGAGIALAQAKKPRIVFLTPVTNDSFIPAASGLKAAAEALGWDYQFIGPPTYDVIKQVDMMMTAIRSKPDAIAVALADPEAFKRPIEEAHAAGIPVLAYNTDVPSSGRLAYVGQDHEVAGKAAGERMLNLLKERGVAKGTIMLVAQNFGNVAQDLRMKGFKGAFANMPYKVEPLAAGVNDSQYIGSLEAQYAALGDVVGIFGVDVMSKNIAVFVEKRKLQGKISAGGWNHTDVHLEGVKHGLLDFSVGQNPYLQGYFPVVMAHILKTVGYPPVNIDTGSDIVDKSSIDAVIKREARWKELAKTKWH